MYNIELLTSLHIFEYRNIFKKNVFRQIVYLRTNVNFDILTV